MRCIGYGARVDHPGNPHTVPSRSLDIPEMLREMADAIEAGKGQQCPWCQRDALAMLKAEECLTPPRH